MRLFAWNYLGFKRRSFVWKLSIVLCTVFLCNSSKAQYTETICSGATLNVVHPSLPSTVTYTWGAPTVSGSTTGATAQASGQPSVNQTLTNNTAVPVTVSYTVACSDPTYNFTLDVTLNPKPVIAASIATTAICSGNTFSFTTASATPGTTITWARGTPAVPNITPTTATGSNNIVDVPVNNGSSARTVTYKVDLSANGCSNSQNVSVTVNPLPNLNSTLTPANICSGAIFSYPPSSSQSPASFAWSRSVVAGITNSAASGTGNPNETLVNNTNSDVLVTYNYLLTATATGCTNTENVSFFVKAVPLMTSTTSATHCSGSNFTYTPTSTLGSTTFNWNRGTVPNINPAGTFGAGPVSEILTNTSGAAATTTYTFSLTANGCTTNNQVLTVTVNPSPVLSSTLTAGNICSNTSFNYTPTSVQSPVTFAWTRAAVANINGNTSNNGTDDPNETLINSTNATIPVLYQYLLTNTATGCSNSQVVTVNVNPIPVIGNYTVTPVICNNNGFLSIPAGAPLGTTYTWTIPSVIPGGAITNTLSAQPVQQPNISELIFNNGTASNADVVYTVTPRLGACTGNPFDVTVTVAPGVSPTIDLASQLNPAAICSGNPFAYTPTSSSPSPGFSWQRLAVAGISNPGATGTGNISESLINTTVNPVTTFYYVTVASAGCTNVYTVNAVVNPGTQLSSSLTPAPVCSNVSFNYTPTSATLSTNQYNWNRPSISGISNGPSSGNGNITETLINTTSAPINVPYQFVLLTSAGCTFSQTVTAVINPAPALSSSLNAGAICSGGSVVYAPASTIGGTLFSWTRAVAANVNNPASAGFNNINESLLNTSLTPGIVTYVYTLTVSGCSSTQSVTATVNPIPAATNQTATICSNNTFTILPSGVPTGTQYTWATPISVPSTVVTGILSGTLQNNISQTLSNTAIVSGVATYTVTPVANGCSGAPFSVDVTVHPRPSIVDLTVAAVCSGAPFTYAPPSVPAGTLYAWTMPVSNPLGGLSGGSAQSAQSTISQTLSSSNNILNNAVYTITPTYNTCSGTAFQLTVPVNPTPAVAAVVTSTCSGNAFTVAPGSVPAGTAYTWTTPVQTPPGSLTGAVAETTPQSTISQLITNNTFNSAQALYSVIPIAGTCSGASFTVTVGINPATQLSSSLTPSAICSNTVFSYTATSNTTSTNVYNWSRTVVAGISNLASTGSGNPNETLVNTTANPVNVTYTYTLQTLGGCSNTQNVVVAVNPTPTLSTTLSPSAVCSAQPFNYSPASATGGTIFNWSRSLVSFISNPAGGGTGDPNESLINTSLNIIPVNYVYTLSANGCTNNQTVTVNINPVPVVGNQTQSICSGSNVAVSPSGVPAGTQYTWAAPVSTPFGVVTGGLSGTLQNNITHALLNNTTAPGDLNYSVVPIANGCSGNSFSITATVKPVPVATDQNIAAICSGNAFSYTPSGMPSGTTYQWNSPVAPGLSGGSALALQASVSQTLSSSNNLVNTAVYDVIPSANGCTGGVFHITVPVNPVPVVNNVSRAVCSGVNFNATPSSAVPAGTTYTWATPAATPSGSVSGFTPGTALSTISQTLTSALTSSVQAIYSVIPTAGTCAGNAFSITVDVHPSTALSSTLTPAAVCSNTVFGYPYTSNTPFTSFAWSRAVVSGISNLASSGTNDPAETLINTTAAPIAVSYVYSLSTPAGCTNTQTVTLTINPTPALSSPLTPAAVCSGTSFTYTPVANTGGSTIMSWARAAVTSISNGAATGSGDPNEALNNTSLNIIPVTYLYSLSFNGCSSTQSVVVNINPVPVVGNRSEQICSNTAFAVNPGGVPAGTKYTWTVPVSAPVGIVGGGSAQVLQNSVSQTLTNATANIATATYAVVPVSNGCNGNTFSVTVSVKPIPVGNDVTLAAVCSGTSFSYTPSGLPVGTVYSWGAPVVTPTQSLTGGSAQTAQSLISQTLSSSNNVLNSAVYDVVPLADGCTGNIFHVTVPVNPVPAVSNQSLAICSGNSFLVSPTNVPVGTTYTWGMPVYTPVGSVSGGSAQNNQLLISQQLTQANTVPVQALYAVTPSAGACTGNPFNVSVTINPGTQMNIALAAADICSNTQFNYAAGSNTPGTNFSWIRAAVAGISNPAAAGINNPLESLINITNLPINVTYVYTLVTGAGCTKTENVTVKVNPIPALTSSLNPAAICSGATFNYLPTATIPATSFAWSRAMVPLISNNAAAGNGNPAEQLVNSSVTGADVFYDFTLTANGCSNTQKLTLRVNPTPVVSNLTTVTCSNTAFSLTPSNVPSGTIYTWQYPSISPVSAVTGADAQLVGQTDIGQLLTNQTVNPATVHYVVKATAGSCTSPDFSVDVTIKPTAVLASQSLSAVCSGTAFTFQPSTVPAGTTYTWSNPVISPASSLSGGGAEAVNRSAVSQTLSSTNNQVNTAVYVVTPMTNGCAGNSFGLTVRVNPTPSIANIRDTVCTNVAASVVPSNVPVNTVYTWSSPAYFPFGALTGGTSQVAPSPVFSQLLANTTTAAASAVYTVRPVADNCIGNDFTVTIVVGASLPNIANQVATVCSGAVFNATPSNQPNGITYTWDAPVVSPASSLLGAAAMLSPAPLVSQLLNNLTDSTSNVVYTVTAHNNGCASNPFRATINVLPIPRAIVTGNNEICRYPNDTLTLRFTGPAPWGFTYVDDKNISHSITGIANAPYKLLVPSTTADERKLLFLNVSNMGCLNTKDTVSFSQIIHSLPVGTMHTMKGIYICNNIPDSVFVTSPDSVGYQWRYNNVDLPGATNDTIVTNLGGRYNVQLTNRFGCVDTVATPTSLIYITQPVLRFLYDTYCINTLMHITNITDTNLTGPTLWQWSFDNGTPSTGFHSTATFATGGDHHIQLKATQLYCPLVPTSFDTTVNIQFPIPGVTMPSMSAYKGVSTPVNVRSLPGYKYEWTPSYGINRPDQAATAFNNQQTQQYAINLISPAGCVTKDSLLIRVFEDKLVDIFIPKSFSPNGDGINDILYPYLTGIKEFKYFKVFNRYNQLMFETKNHDVGWNGTLNGTQQPMAIYIWVAVGIANDGSTVQKQGQVLLLR